MWLSLSLNIYTHTDLYTDISVQIYIHQRPSRLGGFIPQVDRNGVRQPDVDSNNTRSDDSRHEKWNPGI